MPKDRVHGVGEADVPEPLALPGMPVNEVVARDGVSSGSTAGRSSGPGKSKLFTPELLRQMQEDPDIAVPESVDEGPEFIPVERPGNSYITIHPSEKYSLRWAFVYNPLQSKMADDPYLVLPHAQSFFDPDDLKIRWLMLCLRYEDELLKPFLWAPSWYEMGAEPTGRADRARRAGQREEASPFHKSVDRVVWHARQGWGRAKFMKREQVYRWRPWPVGMGEEPGIIWPDEDFFDILERTFEDRIIASEDHPVVQACACREVR
jgi:hypothetical protein